MFSLLGDDDDEATEDSMNSYRIIYRDGKGLVTNFATTNVDTIRTVILAVIDSDEHTLISVTLED